MSGEIYGMRPVDLGLVDINPTEMMFWQYLPVKAPRRPIVYPCKNLEVFAPLVDMAIEKAGKTYDVGSHYVYLTAKRLFVTPENCGNRPGWHSDGFLTNDLNFIWSDSNPTLFWVPDEQVFFTQDHVKSLTEMEEHAEKGPFRTYPNKHLLMLDESVIHRVNDIEEPGMRTFVKISISRHEYRLEGNSINHVLKLNWDYVPRQVERNAPEVVR
jgi:hypothetical protein